MNSVNRWTFLMSVLFLATLLPTKAQASRCYCDGSNQLWYIDHDGNPNWIYTGTDYNDCQSALERTLLCSNPDWPTRTVSAASLSNDACDDLAPQCWQSCEGQGLSCYNECMWAAGCRP